LWPDKDLWKCAGKKSGIFVKKSEKSPFYGGTCFYTSWPGIRNGREPLVDVREGKRIDD
jgi:hypothetical protein